MALKRSRTDDSTDCEFEGCDRPEAQYRVRVELLNLDGLEEAISCRRHVALVAKALAEDLRTSIRRDVDLAELDNEVAGGELAEHRARREEHDDRERGEG